MKTKVSRYRGPYSDLAMARTVPSSNSDRGKEIYLLQTNPDGQLKRHSLLYPYPSRTEVKNEWSYTSVPPLCFHGILGTDLHLWR